MADDGQRLDSDDEEMLARQLIAQRLERLASDAIASGRPVLPQADEEVVTRAVFDRLFHLGRLQPLLDDESIQNVVANGHDRVFIVYAGGSRSRALPLRSPTTSWWSSFERSAGDTACPNASSTRVGHSSTCSFPTAHACSPSRGSALDRRSRSAGIAS